MLFRVTSCDVLSVLQNFSDLRSTLGVFLERMALIIARLNRIDFFVRMKLLLVQSHEKLISNLGIPTYSRILIMTNN